jgi:DNA-binding transcriptional MerR regulator
LAKMAGVSRQTVARWEELGFISRSDIGLSGNKYFVIKEVVSQLERLKDVK